MSAAWLTLAASILVAMTNWISLERKLDWWDPVSKPAVILALIISTAIGPISPPLRRWMVIGLFFSLMGDIFLLGKERYFLAGLLSFLLAHAAYILAFNPTPPPTTIITLTLGLGTLTVSAWIFYRLLHAPGAPASRYLLIPLISYTLLITGTWFSGLTILLRPEWGRPSALLLAAGTSLFYVSDAFLAWHRFISPLKKRGLKVRIPYHLAQICLVAASLLSGLP